MKSPDEMQAQLHKSFLFPHLITLGGMGNRPCVPPVLAQFNELIPELCKLPYDYVYKTDGKALAEGALLVWEYLDLDMAFAILDSYTVEAESIGAKTNYFEDHIPDIDRSDFLIKGPEDLDKIKFQGLDSGRYPWAIDYVDTVLDLIGFPAFPEPCAPWSLATNLYGMENLLIDCIANPEFVHELMNRIVYDLCVPAILALKERFPMVQNFTIADAWCSPPMVTKPIIDEFIEPYLVKLQEALGDFPFSHAAVWLPAKKDENQEALLNLIIKYAGSISGFDPEYLTLGMDFYWQTAEKHGLPWALSVSPQFIYDATPEEAAARGKLMALAGKNGPMPFSVVLACIPPRVPMGNVRALIAAIRTYGAPDADENTPFELPGAGPSFEDFLRGKMANNVEGYSFDWLAKSGLKL